MERKRILTGIVSIHGTAANTKWDEISIDSQQLSHFQHVLMKENPELNPITATGIILTHRLSMSENEGLIFLVEGVDSLGSEDSNFKDKRLFVNFLRETQRYKKIGDINDWEYDKVKSILLS